MKASNCWQNPWQMKTSRPAPRFHCHGYYKDQDASQASAITHHYVNCLIKLYCSWTIYSRHSYEWKRSLHWWNFKKRINFFRLCWCFPPTYSWFAAKTFVLATFSWFAAQTFVLATYSWFTAQTFVLATPILVCRPNLCFGYLFLVSRPNLCFGYLFLVCRPNLCFGYLF